jgi:hypothetical protein
MFVFENTMIPMITRLLLRAAVLLAPITVQAQYSDKGQVDEPAPVATAEIVRMQKSNTETVNASTSSVSPPWAKAQSYSNKNHVYFRDYHVFYTPGRGYAYWKDRSWKLSTTVPTFLQKANLEHARIVVLGTDLAKAPELKYTEYRELYPADPVDIIIPVPSL